MDDKVVPIGRAKDRKDNKKNNDSKIMLSFRRDIPQLENQAARDCLMDAWRKASFIIFSAPPLTEPE